MKSLTNSMKLANLGWITSMILLDILVLLYIVAPDALESASLTKLAAARMSVTGFLPIVIAFLSSLLSPGMKDILVYWRIKDVMPGHRAFSHHAPDDPRIDMARLKKHAGPFPSKPREQNACWYNLYKLVATEPAVNESQRLFLRFRDLAAISLLLTVAAPLILFKLGAGTNTAGQAAVLLFVQYLLAAVAARQNGFRFVTNVLAVHSTKKVRKAPPKPKASTEKDFV